MATTNIQSFAGQVEVTSNLTVDTSTFHVNSQTNSVGLGTTLPLSTLHVVGNVYATSNVTFSDSTASSSTTTGALKVTGGIGVQGALYGTAANFNAGVSTTNMTASQTVKGATLTGTNLYGTLAGSNAAAVSDLTVGQRYHCYTFEHSSNALKYNDLAITSSAGTDIIGCKITMIGCAPNASGETRSVIEGYIPTASTTVTLRVTKASYVTTPGMYVEWIPTTGYSTGTMRIRTKPPTGYNQNTEYALIVELFTEDAVQITGTTTSTPTDAALPDLVFLSSQEPDTLYHIFDDTVGIGTLSPSANLHVNGNVYVSSNLTVDTSTLHVDSATNRVGMGTTSPNEALHVNGNIRIGSAAGTDDNSDRYIKSSGQLVIHSNDSDANNDYVGAAIKTGVSNVSAIEIFGANTLTTYQHIAMVTRNTERMRITGTGNVGIGTVSPRQKLEVANGHIAIVQNAWKSEGADDQLAGKIDFHLGNDTGQLATPVASIEAYDKFQTGSSYYGALAFKTQGTERMRINGGNVGIGTTYPLNILEVRSDTHATFGKATYAAAGWSGIRLGTPYATNHDAYCSVIESYNNYAQNYNSDLRFKTSHGDNAEATERMRIASNGNVGIGTVTPASKFHAAGKTVISENISSQDNTRVYDADLSVVSEIGYYASGSADIDIGATTSQVGNYGSSYRYKLHTDISGGSASFKIGRVTGSSGTYGGYGTVTDFVTLNAGARMTLTGKMVAEQGFISEEYSVYVPHNTWTNLVYIQQNKFAYGLTFAAISDYGIAEQAVSQFSVATDTGGWNYSHTLLFNFATTSLRVNNGYLQGYQANYLGTGRTMYVRTTTVNNRQ